MITSGSRKRTAQRGCGGGGSPDSQSQRVVRSDPVRQRLPLTTIPHSKTRPLFTPSERRRRCRREGEVLSCGHGPLRHDFLRHLTEAVRCATNHPLHRMALRIESSRGDRLYPRSPERARESHRMAGGRAALHSDSTPRPRHSRRPARKALHHITHKVDRTLHLLLLLLLPHNLSLLALRVGNRPLRVLLLLWNVPCAIL